jgi:TPR repeat protein
VITAASGKFVMATFFTFRNDSFILQDPNDAIAFLKPYAENGDLEAQVEIAKVYYQFLRDFEEARRYFLLASEQGDRYAQRMLGIMHACGEGGPRSYSEALEWYRKAAAQNDPQAIRNIGIMYWQGQGVGVDYCEARKWLLQAANLDHHQAQQNLASLYLKGLGGPRDVIEAYKWLCLAELGGGKDIVPAKTYAATLMTPDEITQAERAVQAFRDSQVRGR